MSIVINVGDIIPWKVSQDCPVCGCKYDYAAKGRPCGLTGVMNTLSPTTLKVTVTCNTLIQMKVGDIIDWPDGLNRRSCPKCKKPMGYGPDVCGINGNFVDGTNYLKVKVVNPCTNQALSEPSRKPCTCGLFTVLMVTGCQCGGV